MGSEYGDGADIGGTLEVSGSSYIGDSTSDSLIIKASTYLSGSGAAGKHVQLQCTADGFLGLYPAGNYVLISGSAHGSDTNVIIRGGEGSGAALWFDADEGDDDADRWRIVKGAGGGLYFQEDIGATFGTRFELTDGGSYFTGSSDTTVKIIGSLDGDASLQLHADQGTDAGTEWEVIADPDHTC